MRGKRCRLTPRFDGLAQAAKPSFHPLKMQCLQHAEPRKADENQVDGDHKIEESRHQQDQDACDKGNDRLNVGAGDDHEIYPLGE
jgi:hypothetical protein